MSETIEGAVSASAAPGELELVRSFINTKDVETNSDELGSPEQLQGWLSAHGLMGDGAPDEADLSRAVELREALRAMALINNGETIDEAAVEAFNRVSEDLYLVVRFSGNGQTRLEPHGSGVNAALGHVVAAVYSAMVEGTWQRLKACRNDTCQWAFYDHSKNRSGTWCTMSVCGSRAKTRTYRQRRRARETSRANS